MATMAESSDSPTTTEESKISLQTLYRDPNERLSFTPGFRTKTVACYAFLAGLIGGANRGYATAALRFRAENAHRLPNSQKGWYYYHKSKNYHALWGAFYQGPKQGVVLAFWSGLFMMSEQAWDHWRYLRGGESKDALSTVLAGATTGGLYSLFHWLPPPTAARTVKMGIRIGLAYGLAQDLLGVFQGRHIGYVQKAKEFWEKQTSD